MEASRKSAYHELLPPLQVFSTPLNITKEQKVIWERLLQSGDVINAPTRRDQIAICLENLYFKAEKPFKWKKESICQLFNITRAAMNKQYEKFKFGVNPIGCPPILTPHEQFQLIDWLNGAI